MKTKDLLRALGVSEKPKERGADETAKVVFTEATGTVVFQTPKDHPLRGLHEFIAEQSHGKVKVIPEKEEGGAFPEFPPQKPANIQ